MQASRSWLHGSERRIAPTDATQHPLAPARDSTSRWVWRHAFGEVLIEVVGDEVYVDGQRVVPHGR